MGARGFSTLLNCNRVKDCDDKDIIIISDVDEILRLQSIPNNSKKAMFGRNTWRYELQNVLLVFICYIVIFLTVIALNSYRIMAQWQMYYEGLKVFATIFPHICTNRPFKIENAGWHFSSMGGIDAIVSKLSAYAASHLDTPENKDWALLRKDINTMPLVPIDETFPRLIYENQAEVYCKRVYRYG